MESKVLNKNKNCVFNGPYAGRDLYITMFHDNEGEFVVTHNADIRPVSYFTGRETELKDLRQRIEEGRKSVLVSGMGGIGKTHICRKLFEEYLNGHAEGGHEPFRYIGYIEYAGNMSSSLQNCLKFKQQDNPEQNQEAAWRELEYLASDGKLLLFVDNVNVPIVEDAGLGRLKQIPGAVVLTSRRTSFSKEFEPYRIGFLSTEQCVEIYERIRYEDSGKKVPEEEIPDLEYIIDEMAAGHTITVEFLAHLSYTKGWSAKRLREELTSNGFCLQYKDEEDKLINIQEAYETLYDLSGLTAAEQNILEVFSVFPYIPLAAETCNAWLLADAGVSEEDDILIGLYRKGWLQFDMNQDSYTLHPVFAQFIYEKCKPRMEKHRGMIESCKESLKIPESGYALECKKIIPFAEDISEKIVMDNIIRVQFISELAFLLQYVGEYKKSEELYEICLQICEEMLGEQHPNTAITYNNLAYIYRKQGENEKAEKLYRKSLYIRKNVLGEEHLDTASSYHNLAVLFEAQGKFKEAEELYEKGLEIRKKLLGEDCFDVTISYNGLAHLYRVKKEYERAKELCEKSLKIREHSLGKNHPRVADNYFALAYICVEQRKYEKAEKLYRKSLEIRRRMLGEDHLDTASSYNNLAYVYDSQGEYGKAEKLYEKSIRINKNILGEQHPDTADSYNNLAYVYKIQRKYVEAEELYKKVLQIREKVLGEEHPDTAAIYNNLAGLYEAQEKYSEALFYYLRAYKICVYKLGLNHLSTQVYNKNMEMAYLESNPEGNFNQWLDEQMKE